MGVMLLNQTIEYALRAMACLAQQHGGALRTRDLAAKAQIPSHYLAKILRRMVLADLVVSQRGHGGGFQLSKPPEQIRFSDIFRAMDFDPAEGRCVFGHGQCDASDPCPLHAAWTRFSDDFTTWAHDTTLFALHSDDGESRRRGHEGEDDET